MKYHYRAVNAQGQEVTGTLEIEGKRQAARQLDRQGLTLLELEPETAGQGKARGKAHPRETLMTMHELATLLKSGVPVAEAVDSLANSSHHPQITSGFRIMAGHLRQGESFSLALEQAKLPIPWYFQQLARAGEKTGQLADAIRDAVAQMEYDHRVAADIRSAMVYPAILLISGIMAVLIIFIFVVPNFSGLVGEGAEVPWLGRAVINTGVWFNANWPMLFVALVALTAGILALLRRKHVQRRLMDTLATLPLTGTWLLETETARWASTLSRLLENRVELLQAMTLARDSLRIASLQHRLDQVQRQIRGGRSLAAALQEQKALSGPGCDLVRAGERSGALPELLGALGRLYEASSRERMKRFLQLIEPLAVLLIGAVIGIIIAGVVLAIAGSQDVGL